MNALIYVESPWAYFGDMDTARGDDWNDRPYEHNAGEPYDYAFRVAYDGPLVTPDYLQVNSQWSVDDINGGSIAWLRPDPYGEEHGVRIMAGTSFRDFLDLVFKAGGQVYVSVLRPEVSSDIPSLSAPKDGAKK